MSILTKLYKITRFPAHKQLIYLIGGILFLEFCTMLLIDFLPPMPIIITALIDCSILTILLAPGVYLFKRREEKYLLEQKRTREALTESEIHFYTLANTGQALIWTSGPDKKCSYLNQPWLDFTGRTLEQELGDGWMEGIHPDDLLPFSAIYRDSYERRVKFSMEYRLLHAGGDYKWIQNDGTPRYNSKGKFIGYIGHCLDITMRKQTEIYREVSREILQMLNMSGDINDIIDSVLEVLKKSTGFDAMGIRLQEGEDFPYYAQKGFPSDFLMSENTLIDPDQSGSVCRDHRGKVCLACTCGLILSGNNKPTDPFSTPGGSWWTNDSSLLLNIPPGKDARFHPRNHCVHQGYASVALVPIRNKDKIVGLIQLNDQRKGRLTQVLVEKLEEIASHIGGALIRKHTEELLRKKEERRLSILETAMDGFWLLDFNGRLLEVNQTYCRMSGYTAPELMGMQVSDLETNEDPNEILVHLQRIKTQGEDRFESRHRRKDGSTFDIEISIQYQSTEGGQFVTFLHDITERKRAHESLREKEELLDKAQEIAHLGSWSLDLLTNRLTWSDEIYRIFGLPNQEFSATYEGFLEAVHPEDRLAVNSAYSNSILSGKDHYEIEHRIVQKHSRKILHVYEKCEHIRDDSGKIVRSVGMVLDITERKLAAEALRENERLLRESQAVAHVGSYSADLIHKTWKASPEIYQIFGIDEQYPHTLTGWINCIHPDFLAELTRGLFQSDPQNHLFDYEYKIFRINDGMERWIHGLGEFEYDAEMNPVRLLGTVQDITKRKQSEEELKHLYEQLEDRIQERTAELVKTNGRLLQTEEKYRTMADYTNDWEYWMGPEGQYKYISPSCEKITGFKASDFIENPKLVIDIVHLDDLKKFQLYLLKASQDRNCRQESQFRIVRPDRSIRWIGSVRQSIYDDSGKFLGIRGSNRDITERKKLEQLIKTSNRKYRLLSENITDGIFTCRNGRFEYVNKALNHIFGYEGKELIGQQIDQLIVPEYLDEIAFIYSLHGPLNQKRNLEIDCLRKDQSIVSIEFQFNYVVIEGVIYAVVHDISDKKLVQKNIVKAIILTEEKERAHFSKELHDGLGPLLSTIKLYLQWSERTPADKSREEIIRKAESIVEEALTTVREISNKLSPHLLINYGLGSALQNFFDQLKESMPIQIVFTRQLNRRLGEEIEAAAYRAIIECVNNTIKHAQATTITLTLTDKGDQLLIHYRDDGKGFDVDETLAVKRGLGLFNLQNRIQNIGGKIILNSEPSKGVDYQISVNL